MDELADGLSATDDFYRRGPCGDRILTAFIGPNLRFPSPYIESIGPGTYDLIAHANDASFSAGFDCPAMQPFMVALIICARMLVHLRQERGHLCQVAVIVAPINVRADIVEGTQRTRFCPHTLFTRHEATKRLQLGMILLTIARYGVNIGNYAIVSESVFVGR